VKPLLTRACTVLSLCAASLMAAAPAWALDDGESPGDSSFSTLDGLLVFVGIPLLATLVITLLVYAPHMARGPRYRPGRPYDAPPLWFDGPSRPENALEAAGSEAKDVRGGGASAGW
jgi:hypothetical protein